MHEYGEIFDEAMAMQEAREGNDIIDPEHAELNMSNLQTDLERTTILLYA